MDVIGQEVLWSLTTEGNLKKQKCFTIRKGKACHVKNFMDLVEKVAKIQFKNQGYMMLFRGQRNDHKRKNSSGTEFSSLSPSILRGSDGIDPLWEDIYNRYKFLYEAENILLEIYKKKRLPESQRLERQQILRWSILQHYEICPTPLLDVTQSLRIAASFASLRSKEEAYVYALGVPNLSGGITASAEAGLQIVRLSSVCPPTALRPHFQEGFLLGEYPEMGTFDQNRHYRSFEVDFGRRLVAKFSFHPSSFWESDAFPPVSEPALFPNDNDPLYSLAETIKKSLF